MIIQKSFSPNEYFIQFPFFLFILHQLVICMQMRRIFFCSLLPMIELKSIDREFHSRFHKWKPNKTEINTCTVFILAKLLKKPPFIVVLKVR